MKKLLVIALGTVCLLLAGCSSSEEPAPDPTIRPEMQIVERVVIAPFGRGGFIDVLDEDTKKPEPLEELPEGYGYIGNLTEDQALDSGLAGCKVYADLTLDPSERRDVYLYQPVGENGGEWAYVKYVEILYGAAEEQV